MASNADVAASEDASASIAYEDDFMVREGAHIWSKSATSDHAACNSCSCRSATNRLC